MVVGAFEGRDLEGVKVVGRVGRVIKGRGRLWRRRKLNIGRALSVNVVLRSIHSYVVNFSFMV